MSTYEISKSSFLSLKAEILRKREELIKAKAGNAVKIQVIKKNSPLELKNKGVEARNQADKVEEDPDLLKQSKSALEYKSRLYDKLSSGKVTENDRKRFLVQFDKKRKSNVSDLPPSDDEDDVDKYPESEGEAYNSDDAGETNSSERWIDYVDCLGRTRKCLEKDLKYIKLKDEELRQTMEKRKGMENVVPETVDESIAESVAQTVIHSNSDDKGAEELLSSDKRREILRKKWEEEEERLRNKSDLHYQDILFDEARTHGASYYAFSVDEEERRKQQEALKKLREETEMKQKKAQELKAIREKQLAARIKAAKNRKRARLGLPPEEDEPEGPTEPEIIEEERIKQEEEKKKQEEKEKLLEDARKRHVRPWDIGKEGVKEHYEMTQEEWVEKKRNERANEFAPPATYRKEFRSVINKTNIIDEPTYTSLKFTTKKDKQIKKHAQTINTVDHLWENRSQEDFMENLQIRNESPHMNNYSTPIINECETTYVEDHLLQDYRTTKTTYSKDTGDDQRGNGVEIPPPPTFDYYGPSGIKVPKLTKPGSNIEESIEAGLKFLRQQVEKREKSTNHPREMYLS